MGIKCVAETEGGCGIPAIFCDACGKEIERVEDGNFHWRTDEEPNGAAVYFSHKSVCCAVVDRQEKTANSLDLSDFLLVLTVNLGFDLEKAKAKQRVFQTPRW